MGPTKKINSIVISITTFLMFSIWSFVQYIPEKYTFIKTHEQLSLIVTSVLSFIISIGFYRLIFDLFVIIFNRSQFFKKWILGKTYLEGFWIGCSVGSTGKKLFL